MVTVRLNFQSHRGFHKDRPWARYFSCFILMTCLTIYNLMSVYLRMTQQCIWQFKDRKIQISSKMTLMFSKSGKKHGIWNLIHPSVKSSTYPGLAGQSNTYTMHGQVLDSIDHARYLGVDILSDLNFNHHINRVTANASKSLGFLKRNIKTKHPGISEAAYKTTVRPQVEYASSVWSSYTKKDI